MTQNDIKAIQEIQGTGGFRVIEFICSEKIKKLDSVLDVTTLEEALGRKYAVTLLKELLEDLNLNPKPQGEKRTYE